MPSDKRSYVTVVDTLGEHPKLAGLGTDARWLLIETWTWCSRQRTDGAIPAAVWDNDVIPFSTPSARQALIDRGLIESTASGFVVHDYLAHQVSRASREHRSAVNAANGAQGGRAKARNSRSGEPLANSQQVATDSLASRQRVANGYQNAGDSLDNVDEDVDVDVDGESDVDITHSLLNIPGATVFRAPKPSKGPKRSDGLSEEPRDDGYEETKRRVRENIARSREKGTK